ncbi:unnamed protein product [Microthlaspi erraticum]|uniref:Histone chaperone domain-containing protein n=1 Tax=Microthlaspi erraticum TaxID=1685480 RepID=A0A6D2JLU7_9BRAS|nr:unnamed protein product [Microthlaspi erraticum]
MSGESAVTATETAEITQNVDKNNRKDSDSTVTEFQIQAVLPSCVTYLREKADSFTFESVRRLLEERMELEKYALDVHKSFVEEHLIKCLKDYANDAASENSEEHVAKNDVREEETGGDDDDEKTKGSPENISKTVAEDTNNEGNREALMSDIKRALRKRASYIKDSAETLTMLSLRRILEQDLDLEEESLDPFKKFISKELDEVLQIPDAPNRSTKPAEKRVESTSSKELGSDENSESDAEDDLDDEEVAVEKTETRKRKNENGEAVSGKRKAKRIETDSQSDSDGGDDTEMKAANGRFRKPLKIKEAATPVHGKRVEHLKSVIKSCGMSVPPALYRKVKKAPEEKREAALIEELEQILAKEGLSSYPSEKGDYSTLFIDF